jgi:DNA helicase-2/ATP-dependent DNA helicase PcrA
VNYRSGQQILDLANWDLEQSPLQYQKRLSGTRGNGNKPILHHSSNDFEEADWITETILAGHNNGENFSANKILMRTMSAGRQIEASLVEKKIPYIVIGGQSLFGLAHTKDLLAALRATVNPRDELAWMRYLTLFQGIGEASADRIVEKLLLCNSVKEARSIVEDGLRERTREVLEPILGISRNRNQPGEALRQALQALMPVLEHNYREDWQKRRPDMDLMIGLADRRLDVIDFIETYTLDPIHGTQITGQAEDSVTLITIHSAKGLEGRRIFIPQAQFGMYPYVRSVGSDAEIEEERRILYVALTRAQDELLLSCGRDGYVGSQTIGAANFFLEDAPEAVLGHAGQAPPSHRKTLDLDDLSGWG